jgi:hypothetical protein
MSEILLSDIQRSDNTMQGNRIWNCERLIETLARRGCDGFYPSG